MAKRRFRRLALQIGLIGVIAALALGVWLSLPNGSEPPSASPLIGSATGRQPPFSQPDASWHASELKAAALSVRTPPDWQTLDADGADVTLLPPTTLSDNAGPEITVTFLAGRTLSQVAPPPVTGDRKDLSVAGFSGWQVDDSGILPPFNRYVALQLPTGVLFAQAYRGPGVDLTPFLAAIVSTISIAP